MIAAARRADAARRRRLAAIVATVGLLALPASVQAHPLGNFTINHYAGIEIAAQEIRLDIVIDQAEIPTFQERLRLDTDEDGTISDEESAAAREPECRALAPSLSLVVDGAPVGLRLIAAGLSFPSAAGGLPTMRLVCGFVAAIEGGLADGSAVSFADGSYPERLGWREIVVAGDGVSVDSTEAIGESLSRRLTDYPPDRLASPLAIGRADVVVSRGGPAREPFVPPDAQPLDGALAGPEIRVPELHATVPGGIAGDLPAIFGTADLPPAVIIVALLTALALGAGHALTPGHGKSLMAAYLVGTRGTAIHAASLGLAVTVAHTVGILGLAGLILAAGAALPPDVVVRQLPMVAALTIIGIGAWMLATELRRRRFRREHRHVHEHDHGSAGPATITWRSLVALGLAGGIVPSTSALLILLGTIATGRPAFGVVLVVAFGLGMAVVLAGLGLILVVARDRLERLSAGSRAEAVLARLPLAAAAFVLVAGIWLTGQALLGATAF